MGETSILDMLDIQALESFLRKLSEYTHTATLIVKPDGTPVNAGLGFCALCQDVIRKDPKGKVLCEGCDQEGIKRALVEGKTTYYRCHAGLYDFATPIFSEGKVIGGILGGQVLAEPMADEAIRSLAEQYGLTYEACKAYIEQIPVVPEEKLCETARLYHELGTAVSDICAESENRLKQQYQLEKQSRSQYLAIQEGGRRVRSTMRTSMELLEQMKAATPEDEEAIKQLYGNCMAALNEMEEMMLGAELLENNSDWREKSYELENVFHILKLVVKKQGMDRGVLIECSKTERVKTMYGDMGRLSQLLTRMIGNAVTALKQETIYVKADCEQKGYASELVLQISNTGPQVNPAHARLFIEYMRGNGLEADSYSGEWATALPMIRMLLGQLQGSLELVELDGTSVFELRIPQLIIS